MGPLDIPDEVEATLLARSAGPSVLEAVARLRELGPYALREAPPLTIRDRYFDTTRGDLDRRRLALRVRDSNGEPLLTLKGEERRQPRGVSRPELELPWSDAVLERVVTLLREEGVEPPAGPPAGGDARPGPADPVAALAGMGLVVIQERETDRRRREFVPPIGPRRPLANLDIDSVTYYLRPAAFKVYEVEIEVLDPTFDLVTSVDDLRRRFDELVVWAHSKLAVGKAVEHLLTAGRLTLASDRTIPPQALDDIESLLSDEWREERQRTLPPLLR